MADLTADQVKYAQLMSDLNKTLVVLVQQGNTVGAAQVRAQIQAAMQLYADASTAAIKAQGPSAFVLAVQNLDEAVGGAAQSFSTGLAGTVGATVLALLKPLAIPLLLIGGAIVAVIWVAGKSGAVRIRKGV